MGQEFRRSLVDGSGLGSLMRLCSDSSRGCSHLSVEWDWRIPRWHTHGLVYLWWRWWVLVPYHIPFLGAVWVLLKHASWLLPEWKKNKEEATVSFMSWPQKSHFTISLISYWVHKSPYSVWEEATQGWIPQDGDYGANLQAAYHIWLAPQRRLFLFFPE